MDASISAIHAGQTLMAVSAHNTANLNTDNMQASWVYLKEGPAGQGVDAYVQSRSTPPDAIEETVNQMTAQQLVEVNAQAWRMQDETLGTVIDILA